MHPLYNKSGLYGQPLIKHNEVVWVHTLCAFATNTIERSSGLVYGCDINGKWDDIDNNGVHHFVIVSKDDAHGYGEQIDLALSNLSEFRKLRCFVCDSNDTDSTRIPVQVRFHV
jgi:hypothetical protein